MRIILNGCNAANGELLRDIASFSSADDMAEAFVNGDTEFKPKSLKITDGYTTWTLISDGRVANDVKSKLALLSKLPSEMLKIPGEKIEITAEYESMSLTIKI